MGRRAIHNKNNVGPQVRRLRFPRGWSQSEFATKLQIAGFDISANPGITATLYNLGNPEARAYALKAENDQRRAQGQPDRYPEENYYGWLVNDKLPELDALF